MRRTLLFDSGCAPCTGLARAIERETDGWLVARSLHEPDVRALLDNARPGWAWEPTLIEEASGATRVFTGVALRARMVAGLGPRRAVRVARLVQQATRPNRAVPTGRRTFLKHAGATVAGIALGSRFATPTLAATVPDTSADYDTTTLAPNTVELGRLKTSATVHRANQHFGTPDWTDVRRFTSKKDGRRGYAIPYHGASHRHVALTLGDPTTGEDTKHVVATLVKADRNEATLAFSTADKRALGTITTDKHGQVSQSSVGARPATITPQDWGNWGCLFQCLAASAASQWYCRWAFGACLVAPGPEDPACDAFFICALGISTFCLIVCH